jgi:hypothetical protein
MNIGIFCYLLEKKTAEGEKECAEKISQKTFKKEIEENLWEIFERVVVLVSTVVRDYLNGDEVEKSKYWV